MGKFWNLDTILEQIRLDEIRVGKFRLKHKPTIREFLLAVGNKLGFAVSAGTELAGKSSTPMKEHYMASVRSMFDAWVDPRVENYFKVHPVHEILDMRQFGKFFGGKVFQIILEDPAKKTCVFALKMVVSKQGIEQIKITRKPERDYDFMIRASIDALWVPPNLTISQQWINILSIITTRRVRISGWRILLKFILFGIKEAVSMKLDA
nr:hypothetical protein [Candidatus Sigynarchaeota archaeon]